MGTLFTKKRKPKPKADIYELAVFGYFRRKHNTIYLPKDIKYLCLKFYRIDHLVIQKWETRELFCTKYHAPYIFESITIKKHGKLTVNGWDPDTQSGGTLYITCKGDITLKSNACIDLTGKGYAGGTCGNNGESFRTNLGGGGGYKQIDYYDNAYAGGGGYHTRGIQFNRDPDAEPYLGGYTYGDYELSVLHLGSGGGSCITHDGNEGYGGSGGGALKLKCFGTIKLSKNASICCNGNVSYSYESGSGSGGSIHIIVNNWDDLKMRGLSRIEAVGGKKGKYNSNGGFGRIRFEALSEESQKKEVDLTKYQFNPKPYCG